MPKVAIIGFMTLERYALAGIIKGFQDTPEVAVKFFDDSFCVEQSEEKFDLYLVTERQFISGLEYYMLKKSRTLVWIFPSPGCSKRERRVDVEKSVGFQYIYSDSPLEKVVDLIQSNLKSLTEPEDLSLDLTGRELEVLREIASGKTNKEVAESLSISVNTVITHRKNISAKLGIKSVSGLSLYALMNGII